MGSIILQNYVRKKDYLAIRKHFDLFANLRPVKAVPSLLQASPLKEEIAKNVDLLIVRELNRRFIFRGTSESNRKSLQSIHLFTRREEIERIVEKAFELARLRRGKVTSVDKANVLESSKLMA